MTTEQIIVKVATQEADIEKLRPFWSCVNRHPESDIDFVLMLASVRPKIIQPYVVAAYRNDQPVALMIGRVEQAIVPFTVGYFNLLEVPLKQLVFVHDGFVGERSEGIAAKMIDEIKRALKLGVAERALLDRVSVKMPLIALARNACPILLRDYSSNINEHWRTNLPENYQVFLSQLSGNHRRKVRRISKDFESDFADKVRYVVVKTPDDVDLFCQAAEEVARKTYQRGLGAGFIDDEENRKRLHLIVRKNLLRAHLLLIEDRPVAFCSCEQGADVAHLIWTAFDPAFRNYEVGTILFMKMLEDLMKHQVTAIDYGPGAAAYKQRLGDTCLMEQDVTMYAPTIRACLVNVAKTLEQLINRWGNVLLVRLKLREKVKRIWRSGLAGERKGAADAASAS